MMTLATALTLLNMLVVGFLAVNAWVQKITGKRSQETRLVDLEAKFTKATTEFSKVWGEIQRKLGEFQLEQARQEEHLKFIDAGMKRLEHE